MKVPASSLLPILRSDTQGRLLARLYAEPDRAFSLSELVRWSDSSIPTVSREIDRAQAAGMVTTERMGNMRLVRVRTDHPLHRELRRIILSTYGPPIIVAEEFGGIEGIEGLMLFGSWAARYQGEPGAAPNDLDVLVIGDVDRNLVDEAADRVEQRIALPVQATVRSGHQWDAPNPEGFIAQVRSRPLVTLSVTPSSENAVETI